MSLQEAQDSGLAPLASGELLPQPGSDDAAGRADVANMASLLAHT
jgi:hypothetical protein